MGWKDRFRIRRSENMQVVDELECERLIKLKGSKLEIAGIEIQQLKLGKLGYESTLRQTVNQSIILLDASQYDLCKAIKGLKDSTKKEKYKEMMIEDKIKSRRITEALAVLLANPESKELQAALKSRLLESTPRLEELDRNKEQLSKYTDPNVQTVLETGNVSLTNTLTNLKSTVATDIVQEDLSNMNLPGTETTIKKITKEVPSDTFNPNEYYFSPDGTYAIHKPPANWKVREAKMIDLIGENLGIDNEEIRDALLRQTMQKVQYEKFQRLEITIYEYDKPYFFEPIPGKTSVNGRDGFPTALQIIVPIQLVIIPFEKFQPPLFTESSLVESYVRYTNDLIQQGALSLKDLTLLPSKECIVGTFEQQLKNVLVLGEEKETASINMTVFGFRGPIRDYIILIRYPIVKGSSSELEDISQKLSYLVGTFKLLPARESDKIEENQKKETNFTNLVKDLKQEIFDSEYHLALIRMSGLNLDDLNDVNKAIQTFKPFATYVDYYKVGEVADLDIKGFTDSYNKAKTGDVNPFRNFLKNQLHALNDNPDPAEIDDK